MGAQKEGSQRSHHRKSGREACERQRVPALEACDFAHSPLWELTRVISTPPPAPGAHRAVCEAGLRRQLGLRIAANGAQGI